MKESTKNRYKYRFTTKLQNWPQVRSFIKGGFGEFRVPGSKKIFSGPNKSKKHETTKISDFQAGRGSWGPFFVIWPPPYDFSDICVKKAFFNRFRRWMPQVWGLKSKIRLGNLFKGCEAVIFHFSDCHNSPPSFLNFRSQQGQIPKNQNFRKIYYRYLG